MQVLVTGGTGFLGSNLTAELADRGHDVTALARHPDETDLHPDVKTVYGDVTDRESLVEPIEGQDAVFNLVALSPLFEPSGGNEMHDVVHRQGTDHVISVMEEAGVDRLLQLSALDADPDGPTHYIRAKGRADEAIRASDLDWTIVQPSILYGDGAEFLRFTSLLTPPYIAGLPSGGSTPFQPIWVGDFVELLGDALEDETHVGRTYQIGGPEVLTLGDVAKLIHRSKGRPLVIVPIPMPVAKLGLTLGGILPFFPMGPDQYQGLLFDSRVDENGVAAFGVDPSELRTMAEYFDVEPLEEPGVE